MQLFSRQAERFSAAEAGLLGICSLFQHGTIADPGASCPYQVPSCKILCDQDHHQEL